MPSNNSKSPNRPVADGPVINEQADRTLIGIIRFYGIIIVVLMAVAPIVMAAFNLPSSRLYSSRHMLDALSLLIIMTPFFLGINQLFGMRLKIGRDLVEKRQWKQAIAALDPFAGMTQRFLDSSGEAHYLLSLAYAGIGNRERAEVTRNFVLKHRRGPWATKLEESAPVRSVTVSEQRRNAAANAKQENAPRTSKPPKRRRRF